MSLRLLGCATLVHGNACCRAANGAGLSPVVWPSMLMHRCAGPCVLRQGCVYRTNGVLDFTACVVIARECVACGKTPELERSLHPYTNSNLARTKPHILML
jgi:hypothetical protein